MKGTVAKFNAKRGFGFIRSDQLDNEIFVHITKVIGRRALRPGQDVTFDTEQTDKGLAAVNVAVQGGDVTSDNQQRSGNVGSAMSPYLLFGGISIVLIIIIVLVLMTR